MCEYQPWRSTKPLFLTPTELPNYSVHNIYNTYKWLQTLRPPERIFPWMFRDFRKEICPFSAYFQSSHWPAVAFPWHLSATWKKSGLGSGHGPRLMVHGSWSPTPREGLAMDHEPQGMQHHACIKNQASSSKHQAPSIKLHQASLIFDSQKQAMCLRSCLRRLFAKEVEKEEEEEEALLLTNYFSPGSHLKPHTSQNSPRARGEIPCAPHFEIGCVRHLY